MSQAGELNVVQNHPDIPTLFIANVGSAVPLANELEILGTGSITTTGSGNTITISLAGGGNGIETITGDSGGPVGPDPGTFNLDLIASPVSGIDIVGTPLTFTLSVSNLRDVGRYVVSPIAGQAGFTTIQAAINQAVLDGADATRPATVWIFSGTYTENLTLAPFVNLASKAINSVNIIGNSTFTSTDDNETISFHRINFTTPIGGGNALNILGTNSCLVIVDTCTLNGNTGSAFFINNPNSGFGLFDCIMNANSGFKIFDITDCSNIRGIGCNITTTDTASTIGGNSNILFIGCYIQDFFTLLGNAFVSFKSGTLVSLATFPCVDIGPTNNCVIFDVTIACNATSGFWATGTGNLFYAAVTPLIFFPAQQIDPNVNIINQPLANRNLSFDGGLTSIVNDGELIIGSSTSHPQIATLSTANGINVVNGPGSITISNLRDVGRYVVAPVSGQAGYTSIQTAINQAVTDGANATTPATVWIMSGTYTENLTLAPFVSLACKALNTVTIIGNATFTSANSGDTITLDKVTFTTPGGAGSALSILGTIDCLVFLESITVNATTDTGITINNASAAVIMFDCVYSANAGFKILDIIDGARMRAFGCSLMNTDTASTISGNTNILFISCYVQNSFVLTGNAFLSLKGCLVIDIGTNSVLTIGPTNFCIVFDTTIGNNATSGFWATGTGNLVYAAVTVLFIFTAQQIDPALTQPNQPLTNRNLSFDGGLTSIVSDGQLIIGSSTTNPQISTLTAGPGISIVNGSGSITISTTGAGFTWNDASGGFTAVAENGYFITATSTATLPATPTQGDTVSFVVDTNNILTITANTGQQIRLGAAISATAGTCANNAQGDSIELVYRAADTTWIATSSIGIWTVT